MNIVSALLAGCLAWLIVVLVSQVIRLCFGDRIVFTIGMKDDSLKYSAILFSVCVALYEYLN